LDIWIFITVVLTSSAASCIRKTGMQKEEAIFPETAAYFQQETRCSKFKLCLKMEVLQLHFSLFLKNIFRQKESFLTFGGGGNHPLQHDTTVGNNVRVKIKNN